jgi:hypothetical protein
MYGLVLMGFCQKGLGRPGQCLKIARLEFLIYAKFVVFWRFRQPGAASNDPKAGTSSQQRKATGALSTGQLQAKIAFSASCSLGACQPRGAKRPRRRD